MEANKRNAIMCLTRARNTFMDNLEVVYVRKVQNAMDEILTPAATSSSTATSNSANTSSTAATSSSNSTLPPTSSNSAPNPNGTASNPAAEISTNNQAMHLVLEAWDYYELAEDYTSADVVKKLGEEVFGEDAWGSAVVKYVDEEAITKHPGVEFSA